VDALNSSLPSPNLNPSPAPTRCVDACKSVMLKDAGGHTLQEASNGSLPAACLLPCSKIGSFVGKCIDVRGEQLDEQGELF